MSVPRDSMTIIPAICSDKDLSAFKDKFGDKTEYYIECGTAETQIKKIAKEFPNISFFGYITYNNSCSFEEYYYQNIIFNGNGLTYIGSVLQTSVGVNDPVIHNLKICGDRYWTEEE